MTGDIAGRLQAVRASLPHDVTLVAVSKYHPTASIAEAYRCGQRIFGESREQELSRKAATLPPDIEWHFIGHLQTNKVRLIAPYIAMIETVDSLRLLREVERQGERFRRTIRVLLELHIAEEDTKTGLTIDECKALLDDGEWRTMSHVSICGIMMMASNTDDTARIEREFRLAADTFQALKNTYFAHDDAFAVRSWGMSGDYPIAVRCQATHVRIGTAIFGERQ